MTDGTNVGIIAILATVLCFIAILVKEKVKKVCKQHSLTNFMHFLSFRFNKVSLNSYTSFRQD